MSEPTATTPQVPIEPLAQPLSRAPIAKETLDVVSKGLEPRAQVPKRVVVIGAGVAGLVAAYELARVGHDPVVLEAQHRVGGRIYTLRDFAPGMYAEAGAMRIPRAHDLTLGYCRELGLELRPFVMGNPKGLVYLFGQRLTMAEAAADPDRLGFAVHDRERGKNWDQLWDGAIADLVALHENEGDAAWPAIAERYDRMSLFDFLTEKGWSEGAIEMFGLMNFVECDLHQAVMEQLYESLGKAFVDMQEIVGGMDRLPCAFFERIEHRVRFGAEVEAIDQSDTDVTVHYCTEAGQFSVSGDYAICTLPFSVLRNVEALKPFSREKQKAIRQLNYSASTKILFQVRRRRWEQEDGIVGGATVTDLSVRRLNYPNANPDTERGVLLASYTWGQEALRWDAMDDETRLEQALEDVSRIHPWIREEYEVGTSHAWYDDNWARGAFAFFSPGQVTDLHPDITRPEGRVHFAGEHCSLHHAWIQGALESGIRAAREINEA